MKKSILFLTLISTTVFLSACVNKHGISMKYYSDCKEYYDLQGYYHKECGEDDIRTYKEMKKDVDKGIDYIEGFYKEKETKPSPNVW